MSNKYIGKGTRILKHSIVYESWIGDNCLIGNSCVVAYSKVGNNCIIENLCLLCKGVTLEDDVFVGDAVIFCNDKFPSIVKYRRERTVEANHKAMPTLVKKGAAIGSGCVIICGVTIGENALLGGGSTLTHDIPAGEVWAGNPAHKLEDKRNELPQPS
jgi:acetyltransferase-like isoleucine patch superfamily enzyme